MFLIFGVFLYLQSDKDVESFRQKFAGSQADRIVKAEAEAKQITEQLKKAKVSGYSFKNKIDLMILLI